MKMADLPRRIEKPLDQREAHSGLGRPRPDHPSPLYVEARSLEIGGKMKVPLQRSGITSRFKRAMPDKVFRQMKLSTHLEITRIK